MLRPTPIDDYVPHPRLLNGHAMTLFAWARPRHFPMLPMAVPRLFDVAADTRVLAHCHWHRRPGDHPTLLALHGLEGSSDVHYMRGLADKAFSAGFNVVRLNQRNCGGSEHLSAGLYHSGLTADPIAVMRELVEVDGCRSIAVAGYSLGGNLALKLAGELGAESPPYLRSVYSISPTLDLARCVDALERRQNLVYESNFVRRLKRRMKRKARLLPGRFPLNALQGVHTVRAFDEAITAPFFGFRDAADYYYRASALRVTSRVQVPSLIVSADDDPFVPSDQFGDSSITENPHITVITTRHGGHCGFVAERHPGFDGYWAERVAVDFAATHAGDNLARSRDSDQLSAVSSQQRPQPIVG